MVTIQDIAKALGVTPSTVSRSLSGSPRVKASTREAVLRKAEELGYVRNAMASTLRSGKANVVGVVVPRINREFFSNVISSAESVLNEYGYSVLICQTHERLEDEIRVLKTLVCNRVGGIMISHAIGDTDGSHISEIVGKSAVIVQFDRVFDNLPGPKVINDNVGGGYEATRHLLSRGYHQIGILAGVVSSNIYADRLAGYRKALEEAGIVFNPDLVFYDAIQRNSGYQAGMKAIQAGCDALYCTGDYSALGALEAVRDSGLSIPGDFGIVGTADEKFTSIMSPSVTSLSQHPRDMGRLAAEAFIAAVAGEETSEVVVPMELLIRESTGKNT